MGLLTYVTLPSQISAFDQEECERGNALINYFYFLPIIIFKTQPLWFGIIIGIPFGLTAIGWIVALILKRKEIWAKPTPRTAW